MVRITDLNNYFSSKVNQFSINRSAFVFTESQFVSISKTLRENETILIVVCPTYSGSAQNEDAYLDHAKVVIWVLKRINPRSITDADKLGEMSNLQEKIDAIKKQMIEDKISHFEDQIIYDKHIMAYLIPESFITEPEDEVSESCGWSLSFSLLTPLDN